MSRGARLALLAIVICMWLVPRDADAEVRRYALIVAHSGNAGGELAPLEYADDDGARYYELFTQLAGDVRLYTVLDASTQQLHPAVAKIARTPRRADILRGLGDVFERIKRDNDAGHDTIFYFVLVGHGTISDGGEGTVALLDGAFSRTDMFQQVLAKSPATTNHVVVDACNAYYLVHRRGDKATKAPRRDAVAAFLAREGLERYPNTGFLLSTSSEKDTHEWSAYRAGVFSHELRSAMIGGADINGDGQIAYSEVSAFLAAANQHVTTQARVDVFARAPSADLARPLIDLRAARFAHWLQIPTGSAARVYLEDHRGVRYADVHASGKHPVVFGLVPSTHYFVRSADGSREVKLELDRKARIDLDRSKMKPVTIAARGAVEQSFRLHLYAEPFDADYYRGYIAAQGTPSVALDAPRWRPGPPDREHVDTELRRLNATARTNAALRRSMNERSIEIVRAIEAGEHDKAAELLRSAETAQ
jgi:hypothetical protein